MAALAHKVVKTQANGVFVFSNLYHLTQLKSPERPLVHFGSLFWLRTEFINSLRPDITRFANHFFTQIFLLDLEKKF